VKLEENFILDSILAGLKDDDVSRQLLIEPVKIFAVNVDRMSAGRPVGCKIPDVFLVAPNQVLTLLCLVDCDVQPVLANHGGLASGTLDGRFNGDDANMRVKNRWSNDFVSWLFSASADNVVASLGTLDSVFVHSYRSSNHIDKT